MKLSKLQETNLKTLKSRSAQIHYLYRISNNYSKVAKHLNIIYQHVWNEINRKCKNPKEDYNSLKI